MKSTYRLSVMALLVALGTMSAHLLWFPAGIAKAYPVQHAVNVISGILLGPGPAVLIAFVIGLLRNLLGVGTLLAFPGGMIGAFLAGFLYRKIKRHGAAAIGEIIGTGIIGSLISVPFAQIFMNKSVAALAFVPPFLISSVSGAVIGLFLVSLIKKHILTDTIEKKLTS
ncbi:MAG: energy coupling factor transporter S component ThiW [Bacillaceae bacterium]|nr:energy coupling factor transporter S component ThiW [Bacillaceae bacterium]